jgi:hypothetical protein
MSTGMVQGHLQGHNIIMPDMKLPTLTFDCQGFHELDSLDAMVNIKGMEIQSLKKVKSQSFHRSDPAQHQ